MDTSKIREHMEVVGSCGKQVGFVDRVEGESIKLTKDTSGSRGEHRYIPASWVARVDEHVHLSKPAGDVKEEWQAHPVRPNEVEPAGGVSTGSGAV
jgi:hypothetical protein